MKIYTGNFANITKYIAAGLTPISIAMAARHFTGILYRKLNPDISYLTDDPIDYEPKYNKKLLSLDANIIFNELKSLSKGKDIVLLCNEGEHLFCHRHLVARWLTDNLNIKVVELGRMKEKEQQIQQ
jgi:hypothetical protein